MPLLISSKKHQDTTPWRQQNDFCSVYPNHLSRNLPHHAYTENGNTVPITPLRTSSFQSVYQTPSIYLLINKGSIHAEHDNLKQEIPNSRHFSYKNIDSCGALPWKELFWPREHRRRIRCLDLTETNTPRRHPPNKRTGTEKCFSRLY